MNKKNTSTSFEEDITQSFNVPSINPQFVDRVYADLLQRADTKARSTHYIFGLRPGWALTIAIVSTLILSALAIGPQRVYAEFMKLFGYIPGAGIVDISAPIRVLAQPVSVTREGVTLTVTAATLSAQRTQIDYRIIGVPGNAYSQDEQLAGCTEREYLRLPDGTHLQQINGGYQPVPADVNEASFVVPCIRNTLPGKAPENWEIPLQFIPAPTDLEILPVVEVSAEPAITEAQQTEDNLMAAIPEDNSVSVTKVIETNDGYILIGNFKPQNLSAGAFQRTGNMEIRDANGKQVAYHFPEDGNALINQETADVFDEIWAVQFKAAGLVYPLTISFSGVTLNPAETDAPAAFTFDAGSDPKPGQEWSINQKIELAGQEIKILSVSASSRGGYSFNFEVSPDIYGFGIQINGYTPNGGGGGGGGLAGGSFNSSLSFDNLPTGMLTVELSNLILIGESVKWQTQWTPAFIRADLPPVQTLPAGVCLTPDSLSQLEPAPTNMFHGKALLNKELDAGWGLVIQAFDGSESSWEIPNSNWETLSPDGNRAAYVGQNNELHIVDLASQDDLKLPGATGYNLRWSPDGKQIAYIGMSTGSNNRLLVVDVETHQILEVADMSFTAIVGWSPEGSLYFAAPYTVGAAWEVYAYDFSAATTQVQFTIENGTPKFLNPQLSPDGNWIAYRGRDNSSLYLVHPDGSDMHLVLDNVGAAGIAWATNDWLGISIMTADPADQPVLLLNPHTCESYWLSGLNGQLESLFLQ